MVTILIARNANEAVVVPMVGSGGVCIWQKSGVRQSVLCWCVWEECGFGPFEDVFTFSLVHKEIL
jgi:hypothetical protein